MINKESIVELNAKFETDLLAELDNFIVWIINNPVDKSKGFQVFMDYCKRRDLAIQAVRFNGLCNKHGELLENFIIKNQ